MRFTVLCVAVLAFSSAMATAFSGVPGDATASRLQAGASGQGNGIGVRSGGPGNGSWMTEYLDSATYGTRVRGWAPSFAFDVNDNGHVAYETLEIWDQYNDLAYARWNGSAWENFTVDKDSSPGHQSLALDSQGYPHISYTSTIGYDEVLKYAFWDGATWHIETVDAVRDSVSYTSLALDENDRPHIAYTDSNTSECYYTKWTGSAWETTVIDTPFCYGMSLALDAGGYPHIGYTVFYYILKHTYLNETGWHSEVVDSSSAYISGPRSLAIDSSGRPHVTYEDVSSVNLKYAHWTGTEWKNETVDGEGDVGAHSSIALDGDGYPRIGYADTINSYVKCARWDGSSWHTERVEADAWFPSSISIAIDSGGVSHIVYDNGLRLVKHARKSANEVPDTPSRPSGIQYGNVGVPYSYSTSTTDPDNDQIEYTFDWDDTTRSNTGYLDSGLTAVLSHSWSAPGTYQARVFAVDTHNASSAWSEDLTVIILAPPGPMVGGWRIETVDWRKVFDDQVSLALDSNGRPHLAYTGTNNSIGSLFIVYTTFDGGEWVSQAVVHPGPYLGRSASIAVDGADEPHIAYVEEITNPDITLMYARREGGEWQLGYVAWLGETGYGAQLATDTNGNPHVVTHYDPMSHMRYDLVYLRREQGSWGGGGPEWYIGSEGGMSSLAVDKYNRPHITWYNSDTELLRHAVLTGAGWAIDDLETSQYPMLTSIDTDSNGDSHLIYCTPGGILYLRRRAVYWEYSTIYTPGGTCGIGHESLALDSRDLPHIAFYSPSKGLMYAHFERGIWRTEVVESGSRYGEQHAIEIDENDIPHIAYRDSLTGHLKYASRRPNSPPEKPSGPFGPSEGSIDTLYDFSAATTDPDHDPVRYVFDWDDGTETQTAYLASGTTGDASHSWGRSGTYKVNVRAMDSLGMTSQPSDPLNFTIPGPPRPSGDPMICVGGTGPYNFTTIQAAIDAARPGTTICVYNGTYAENLMVEKRLTVVGQDKNTTVIDGGHRGPVLTLEAEWVNITGFTIKNGGPNSYGPGVVGRGASHAAIIGNRLSSNSRGIALNYTDNATVARNAIASSYESMRLLASKDNLIEDNFINGGWWVNLDFSDDNSLMRNEISNSGYSFNLRVSAGNTIAGNEVVGFSYGAQMYYSDGNVLRDNIMNNSIEFGITLDHSSWNTMEYNAISGDIAGVYGTSSNHNNFTNNLFADGWDGATLWCSSNNSFSRNMFSGNRGHGLSLDRSEGNKVFHNTFANNSIDAYDDWTSGGGSMYPNEWDDGYPSGGNYWAGYSVPDVYSGPNQDQPGSDGIGDVPYPIPGASNVDRYPLMTQPKSPPTKPLNFTATVGPSHVDLSWSPPLSDGGSPITNYVVYRGTTPGNLAFLAETGPDLNYTDSAVVNGKTYRYAVRAKNSWGEGPPSDVAVATPMGAPTPPRSLSASARSGRVMLNWLPPLDDGGFLITNYTVYRGENAHTLSPFAVLGNVLSFTDATEVSEVEYFYRVTATNSLGEGQPSNAVSTMLSRTTSPPPIIKAREGDSRVTLTRIAPTSNGGSVDTGHPIHGGVARGVEHVSYLLPSAPPAHSASSKVATEVAALATGRRSASAPRTLTGVSV